MDPYTWVQIAILVISAVVSYSNRPKAEKPKAASMEDIEVPQIDEGTPMAVTFGDCWASDWIVLGMGNFRTRAIRTKGGKK